MTTCAKMATSEEEWIIKHPQHLNQLRCPPIYQTPLNHKYPDTPKMEYWIWHPLINFEEWNGSVVDGLGVAFSFNTTLGMCKRWESISVLQRLTRHTKTIFRQVGIHTFERQEETWLTYQNFKQSTVFGKLTNFLAENNVCQTKATLNDNAQAYN